MNVRWIAGLLFLTGLSSVVAAEKVLQVGSAPWAPYTDQGLPEMGLANDLVNTALRRAGYTPYGTMEHWNRILEGAKIGVYDVVATPWYSDERNEYLDFSEPYLENQIVFVKKKESPFEYTKYEDLNGMMIGVVVDYAYDERFNGDRNLIKIAERHLIQNLLKLTQGRIDLTLDDSRVLDYEINQFMPNRRSELVYMSKPLAIQGMRIGVSRDNPEHAQIVAGFNKAMAEMKKDGTYQKIIDKHKAYIEKPVQ